MRREETPTMRAGRLAAGAVVCAMGALFAGGAVLSGERTHAMGAASVALPDSRIDINRADAGTLALLPGIGPTLGERIVTDRESRGAFTKIDDLDRVRGIGPRKVEGVRGYVVIR